MVSSSSHMFKLFLFTVAIAFVPSCHGLATINRHGADQTPTYAVIQSAINAAQDGDIIKVDAGIHSTAHAMPIDKSITLQGSGDPDTTAIIFTGDRWITLASSVQSIIFKNITISQMNTPLDISSVDVTIEHSKFVTQRSHQILKKIDVASPKSLTISNSLFEITGKSTAPIGEGGIAYLSLFSSTVDISSSVFKGGLGTDGGCFYVKTHGTAMTQLTFDDVEMAECGAQNNGGAMFLDMGNSSPQSKIRITSSTIKDNAAASQGGAIYFKTILAACPTAFSISGSTIENNSATRGGAFYVTSATYTSLQADNTEWNVFRGNGAGEHGGAIYLEASSAERSLILRASFIDNAASSKKAYHATLDVSPYHIPTQSGNYQGGVIFVSGPLDASSPQTVKIDFKQDSGHTTSGSRAPLGAVIASSSPLEIKNLYTMGNIAGISGGALYLEASTKLERCTLMFDESTSGNGGAVYISKGDFEMDYTLIKHAKSGRSGGGISAEHSISSVKLTYRSYIIACESKHEGPAMYIKPTDFGTAVRPAHIPAVIDITMDDYILIGHNKHATSAAVVIYATSSEIHFTSSNSEYKGNTKGHITFFGSTPSSDKKIVLKSGQLDRFDDTPMQNGGYAIRFKNVKTEKSFTGTFFAGSCGGTQWDVDAMVEECSQYSYPQYRSAGWYGAWQSSWKRGCEHSTRGGAACGSFPHGGRYAPRIRPTCPGANSCVFLSRPDVIRSPRRYPHNVEQSVTTTTTTTTTTPAPPSDPYPYCNQPESEREYLGWDTLQEGLCRTLGHCWAGWNRDSRLKCYAQRATGQDKYTPGTSCYVPEHQKQTHGLGYLSKDNCINYKHACWHHTLTEGRYCFWPTALMK